MADGAKVTFTVELDDSLLSGQLNKIASQIGNLSKGKDATVHVNANIGNLKTGVKNAETEINKIDGAPATVHVNANIDNLKDGTKEAETERNAIDGESATVNINADTDAFDAGADHTEERSGTIDTLAPTVTVTADTSAFDTAADNVEARMNSLNSMTANPSINGSDDGQSTSGNTGVSGAMNSVTGLFGSIFQTGSEYEKSRAKASTLMQEGTDLGAWDETVLGLSTKYGQSASGFNEAAYSMLSALVAQEKLPEVLDTSAMLAVGGFTDVPAAADFLASSGNAFGRNDYKAMGNNALLAQNYGMNFDVGVIARTMPMVNSAAANAGVSQEQLLSAMAAITNNGVPANVGVTQLKAMINELDKGGTTGQKTLAEATGIKGATISGLMGKGWTLGQIAQSIGAYKQESGMSYADMFSSQEAGSAIANILGSENGKVFNDALEKMTTGVDAVTPAFETMADTTSFRMDQIATEFENAKSKIFAALAPSLEKLLGVITSDKFISGLDSLINSFAEWVSSDGMSNFIDSIAAAANWLMDTLQSEKSIGEILGETLQNAVTVALPFLLETFNQLGGALLSGITQGLPDWIRSMLGLPSLNSPLGPDMYDPWKGSIEDYTEYVNKNYPDWEVDPQTGYATKKEKTAENQTGFGGGFSDRSGTAKEGAGAGRNTPAPDTSGLSASMDGAASSADSASSKLGALGSAITSAASAISSAASRINSVRVVSTIGVGGGNKIAKKSVGLSYVPYDGYQAILHKGEAVLTAAQASSYRLGSPAAQGIDYDALAGAMSGMTMSMDSRMVGQIIERSVSKAQGARVARSSRGFR